LRRNSYLETYLTGFGIDRSSRSHQPDRVASARIEAVFAGASSVHRQAVPPRIDMKVLWDVLTAGISE
jgi:hypothetical protein